MQFVKKAAQHALAVVKGILFIGFSVQIGLGLIWMCRNFAQVQDFGEPDSALYGRLFVLLWGNPCVLYVLQLAAAFFAGCFFLRKFGPAKPLWVVWRGLVLLTFPFAMQCHLALQPYSIMGSLFLVMLAALMPVGRKSAVRDLAVGVICLALFVALSGVADKDRRETPGYSLEAAMASRFAWPTIWNDFGRFSDELKQISEDKVWEASVCPDNMVILETAVESRAGVEAAKGYYLELARVGWAYHAPMIIRQIGWDMLGYTVTPIIFQLQLQGEAYDSYSGRNYEIMRDHAPVLTRNYVDYSCWWFGCALALTVASFLLRAFSGKNAWTAAAWERALSRRRIAVCVGICVCAAGILAAVVTMRGAGKMDYKYTIAVNELWLAGVLLNLGGWRRERK